MGMDAVFTSASALPSERGGQARWDYKLLRQTYPGSQTIHPGEFAPEPSSLETELQRAGAEGWECIGFVSLDNRLHAVLKRPTPNA